MGSTKLTIVIIEFDDCDIHFPIFIFAIFQYFLQTIIYRIQIDLQQA